MRLRMFTLGVCLVVITGCASSYGMFKGGEYVETITRGTPKAIRALHERDTDLINVAKAKPGKKPAAYTLRELRSNNWSDAIKARAGISDAEQVEVK